MLPILSDTGKGMTDEDKEHLFEPMFEMAQRGTLFLDEVGEMSPWTQVKLLRALQERKVRKTEKRSGNGD